jgi:hypothetical protein
VWVGHSNIGESTLTTIYGYIPFVLFLDVSVHAACCSDIVRPSVPDSRRMQVALAYGMPWKTLSQIRQWWFYAELPKSLRSGVFHLWARLALDEGFSLPASVDLERYPSLAALWARPLSEWDGRSRSIETVGISSPVDGRLTHFGTVDSDGSFEQCPVRCMYVFMVLCMYVCSYMCMYVYIYA